MFTQTHVDGKIGYFFKMTQQAQTIQGSIVAIVTPMFEDGSVRLEGSREAR